MFIVYAAEAKLAPMRAECLSFSVLYFFTLVFDFFTAWDLKIKKQLVTFAQQTRAVKPN